LQKKIREEKAFDIILFLDNIEKLFSFIALMQVFWDTLIICCLGVIIIIVSNAVTLHYFNIIILFTYSLLFKQSFYNEAGIFMMVKVSLAYITIMLEIFLFCFAGEYLSIKVSKYLKVINKLLFIIKNVIFAAPIYIFYT